MTRSKQSHVAHGRRAGPDARTSGRASALAALLLVGIACGSEGSVEPTADAAARRDGAAIDATQDPSELVAYDIRSLRPTEERLGERFDRLLAQANKDNKRVAVLFSADWCESCRVLTHELGAMHPRSMIGDVRIFELKEEDWEAEMRGDELTGLRVRFHPAIGTYPLFVLLDREGKVLEEMKVGATRLQDNGLTPTLALWFESARGLASS